MALAVRLRDAVAVADHFPLLSGVTLDVAEGDAVHLRGPNGAGKTSLLRLCCGLLALRSGEAVVLGHDLSKSGEDRRGLRREVGLLGHSSFLYDDLNPTENVRFALRASGAPSREAAEEAESVLDRLGITGRLGSTPVGRLSAGQRRRTAIAVLVGRKPRLWLLDEPHAGLDQESRDLLDSLIMAARAEGATVIFSSHELSRAERIAGRVVHMAGGRVQEEPLRALTPAGPATRSSATPVRQAAGVP